MAAAPLEARPARPFRSYRLEMVVGETPPQTRDRRTRGAGSGWWASAAVMGALACPYRGATGTVTARAPSGRLQQWAMRAHCCDAQVRAP